MPEWTTPELVRRKMHLPDAATAPDDVVAGAIADAEAMVAARLRPEAPPDPVPEDFAMGVCLLAGAHLLRALASGRAAAPRAVVVGGQRLDHANAVGALRAGAVEAEAMAWAALAPYLRPPPPRKPMRVTPSQPVLGPAGCAGS